VVRLVSRVETVEDPSKDCGYIEDKLSERLDKRTVVPVVPLREMSNAAT
jgi:hypothetical protein